MLREHGQRAHIYDMLVVFQNTLFLSVLSCLFFIHYNIIFCISTLFHKRQSHTGRKKKDSRLGLAIYPSHETADANVDGVFQEWQVIQH